MAFKSYLLVFLFCSSSQQCFGDQKLQDTTLDRLGHLHEQLQDPNLAPVLEEIIDGIHSIITDVEARTAFLAILDETLTMTENTYLMDLFDYAMDSLARVLVNEDVRQVAKKRLVLTEKIFHPDSELRVFIMRGLQTFERLLTNQQFLVAIRRFYQGNAKVLTDAKTQNRISAFLLAVTKLTMDRKSLTYIQQTVRAVDGILSSKEARASISRAVDVLQNTVGGMSENTAKRIGVLHSSLGAD